MRLGERKKKRKQRGDTVEMLKEALNFAPPTFFFCQTVCTLNPVDYYASPPAGWRWGHLVTDGRRLSVPCLSLS